MLLDLAFIQDQAVLGLVAQQIQATPGLPVNQVSSVLLDLALLRPKLCLAWPHSRSRLRLACL